VRELARTRRVRAATVEQYEHVHRLLGGMTAENAPAGLISHTAGAASVSIGQDRGETR